MVERFLKIVESVRKALHDLNSESLLDNDIIPMLSRLCKALKPIKLANLVTAAAILKFLCETLRENNDSISNELLEALSVRIKERRNKDLVTFAKFLQTQDIETSTTTIELPSSSKSAIMRYAKENIFKLYNEQAHENDEIINEVVLQSDESDSDPIIEPEENRDLSAKLADIINESLKVKSKPIEGQRKQSTDLQKQNLLLKEIQIFEKTGIRTKNLQLLLEALMTIQPTSIESERAFSISSNFATKKRSSLSDSSLNALVFLKSFFLKKDAIARTKTDK